MHLLSLCQQFFVKRFCSAQVAGLYFDEYNAKLLSLYSTQWGWRVAEFASVALPDSIAKTSSLLTTEMITSAVQQLVSATRGCVKRVAIALPDHSVVVKRLQLSAVLTARQRETLIPFEAAPHLPFALEDAYFDFQVFEQTSTQTAVDVIFTAASKSTTQLLVKAIEAGGLRVQVIETEAYALARTHRATSRGRAAVAVLACVVLHACELTLCVLQNNVPIFTQHEKFAATAVTDHMQVLYSVQRALQFFQASAAASTIDRIVLAGAVIDLAALAMLLSTTLKVEIDYAVPYANNLELGPNIDVAAWQRASNLSVVTGLALRACDGVGKS